jgi:Cupin-like domain
MIIGTERVTERAFSPAAKARFKTLFPETAGTLTHGLSAHPLLSLEALVALGQRLNPDHVEYNKADLPIGVDPSHVKGNGLSIAETIRRIEDNGSWMVLKWIENDPDYAALLHDTLSELRALVEPVTGAMRKLEGFIFISSPEAVTPFHMDPEHNILLQIRGTKAFSTFPAVDATIVNDVEHERYHMGGHRNLPWLDRFAEKAVVHAMGPGDAIYVPVKVPHWVKVGPTLSISLSVTWRSEWGYRESEARLMNAVLRDWGISPVAPARFPAQNLPKALAYRVARRLPGVKQWVQ